MFEYLVKKVFYPFWQTWNGNREIIPYLYKFQELNHLSLDELLERHDARLQLPQAEGREGIDEENPVSLQAILGLSVDRLSQVDKERFAMASVFGGEPLTWNLEMVAHVWGCSIIEADDTAARFIQRGLLETEIDEQKNIRYRMHALRADYAQALMEEMGL